jgi:small-conductance mechanosensitive channel
MNDNLKRFDVQFSVAYGTDLDIVIKCITNAVQQSNFDDVYNDTTKFTRVIMSGMGNSSVDLELLVWLKGNEILHPRRTKSRFLMLIYKTLYENGITIPFPQLDLHIKKQ